MEESTISAETAVLEGELKYGGIALLHYKLEYPQFEGPGHESCLTVLNQFYAAKARSLLRHCEKELFPLAVEQLKSDRENNFPVRVFEVNLSYQITLSNDCVLSLYLDQYEYTGGAHGSTVRQSQTWNLQRCSLMRLGQLLRRCPGGPRGFVVNAVNEQIAKNPEGFFEDYAKRVSESFDENSFYCTSEALVVYFQQYDIAPYASGIVAFPLPYGGCVLNPAATGFYV